MAKETAGTADAASTNFYDQLTGDLNTTTFTTSPKNVWGNATYFGEGLGIGDARAGDLFGAHKGSVRIGAGIDLTEPALDAEPDAQTAREPEH